MRSKLLGCLLAGLVLLLSQTAPAVWVEARGSFVLEDTGEAGAWSGTFEIGRDGFRGALTLDENLHLPADIPVSGWLSQNRIVFAAVAGENLPIIQFESEALGPDPVQGTFRLGERLGTWEAKVMPLPGWPREPIPRVEVPPDPLEAMPLSPIESPCDLLSDPRAMRNVSAMGERSLREACAGKAALSPGRLSSALAYLQSWLLDFRHWAHAQTPNRLANNPATDTYPRITQNETTITAVGNNPNIILVGYNDTGEFAFGSATGWARSTNGGATWTDRGALLAATGQIHGDPVLASNAGSNVYFANLFTPAGGAGEVGVARSTDGGIAFGDPVIASTGEREFADKPEMAVDRNNGYVYVCWAESGIRFARSITNGNSYTEVADRIDDGTSSFYDQTGCSIATSPGGHVYVAWFDDDTDEIRFKRSDDFGQTFLGLDIVVGQALSPPLVGCCGLFGGRPALNGNIRHKPFPSIAADPLDAARVFVVWTNYVDGSAEVAFSASTNFGNTWSPPVRVNNSATGDQFQPRVSSTVWFAAEPDTTAVRVIWYDRRNDPNNLAIDVYSAISFTGGVTWQGDIRWTDQAFNLPQLCPIYECSGISNCYMGDYIALMSFYPANAAFMGAWGDNRPPLAAGAPCNPNGPAESPDPNIRVSSAGC